MNLIKLVIISTEGEMYIKYFQLLLIGTRHIDYIYQASDSVDVETGGRRLPDTPIIITKRKRIINPIENMFDIVL